MATKVVSPSFPLAPLPFKSRAKEFCQRQPWQQVSWRPKRMQVVRASPLVDLEPSTSSLFLLADSVAGYSQASYYTSLGLFVISVPGLWSLIKRSIKSKIVQKTFIQGDDAKKEPKRVAGEILSFFARNNFTVSDRGEAIISWAAAAYPTLEPLVDPERSNEDLSCFAAKIFYSTRLLNHVSSDCPKSFEGIMVPSSAQAALLTFCTCISLGSVALVLTITVPDFGSNWYWITALSPLAGSYYWNRASRKEQIKVKMMVAKDGTLSEIVVQGDDVQVERMRKELNFAEKGMVYVKGLFER